MSDHATEPPAGSALPHCDTWLPTPCGTGCAGSVALTVDDLPILSGYQRSETALAAIQGRLLTALVREGVPFTPFLNEAQLYAAPEGIPDRHRWVKQWAQVAGSMGNHTYAHSDLHAVDEQAFLADVVRGEVFIESLRDTLGLQGRYFRHPYLHMGLDLPQKRRVDAALRAKGYRIAPVSIDLEDYRFAYAYDLAERDGNNALMAHIGSAYLHHASALIEQAQGLGWAIFLRPIAEILLIHANALNATYLPEVLELLRRKGYCFVSLDSALDDPAYHTPDEHYVPVRPWTLQRYWAASRAPHVEMPQALSCQAD